MPELANHRDLPTLEEVEALYDQSRFVDAYELTASCWGRPELVARLSMEELVMAGRLAHRLGGVKLARHLFREAYRRAPEHPLVRYYCGHALRGGQDLYALLRDFDAAPLLATTDTSLQASWLAYQAINWLMVRDMTRANSLIQQARELHVETAWVDSCAAQVLLADDRWDEALQEAERSWAAMPGMPAAAAALGRALAKLGRFEEAATRLGHQALTGQSCEVAQMACWYNLVMAERSYPASHETWCQQALRLADRMLEVAPLAERDLHMMPALAKLDVALISGQTDLLRDLPRDRALPFVRETLERLEKTPDSELFVLPIASIYQKHNTCLPASIGAALGGLGETIDVEELARDLTFGGTPSWDAANWLIERGYAVRHFIATDDLIQATLQAGIPFIFGMEWDASAHATTAMGLDGATDSLIVHDPSRERWVRLRREAIGADEAPIGPKAMAIVPADQASRLEILPPAACDPLTAFNEYIKTIEREGVLAGTPILDRLTASWPDDPTTHYLQAMHAAGTDRIGDAIDILQRMLQEFPRCLSIRRLLVFYLHRVGNTARRREVLGELVHQKLLMGTHVGEPWRYPPAHYVCQYADLISLSADQADEALTLLHKAIQREPLEAEAYHVLGDVLSRQRRFAEGALAFRIAASLMTQHDHYAAAYADVMRQLGREEEGLAWLRERAERYESRERGAVTWTTLIDALLQYGYPGRADSLMRDVLATHPDHDELLAYGVRYHVGRGEWKEARHCLDALEKTGNRLLHLDIRTYFLDAAGQWREAMASCEEWLAEVPDGTVPNGLYLSFLAKRDGRQAALSRAQHLQLHYPGHDEFEYMVFDWLRRLYRDNAIKPLLRERLARNPDDAWAWRELAHRLMDEVGYLAIRSEDPRRGEVDEALRGCQRTCPDHEVTLMLMGRIAEADGDREAALGYYLQAIEVEPDYAIAYRQAWEVSTTMGPDRQADVQARLEASLLSGIGHLHGARGLALLIAQRFGREAALEAVKRWREQATRDPELLEAEADVLLEAGEGRSDAARAISIIREAIQAYPDHRDLRISLARAHAILVNEAEEVAVWRELLARYPCFNQARLRLAFLLRQGNPQNEEPLALLREAVRIDPLDEEARERLAQFLWQNGEIIEAVKVLREAVDTMPESMQLREILLDCLFDIGDDEAAVEVARQGTDIFPEGAYCWQIYAGALRRSRLHNEPAAIEHALRQALAFNAGLYEAADELAELLVALHRHDDAREVIREQIERQRDPSVAHGRLAWIDRRQGRREEAVVALMEVVRQAPWYTWGWKELMLWLSDDEDKERIEALFAETPAALLDQPELRARRLDLLEVAGRRPSKLVPEWDQLLEDFPRELPLYLRRFDRLWEENRQDEASRVLEKAERFHDHNPYLLARKGRICAHFERLDELRALAATVFTMPGDDDLWPEETLYNELLAALGATAVLDLVRQHLAGGDRLRLGVLKHVQETIVTEEKITWAATFGMSGRGNKLRAKTLLFFVSLLDGVEWDGALHRAVLLEGLVPIEQTAAGIAWWKAHRELVERETPVWEVIGRLLMQTNDKQARDFLRSWRERRGVGMFAVCNYLIVLHRLLANDLGGRTDLQVAIRDNAAEALRQLAPDHTARYLASALGAACLRLKDDASFLQNYDHYRSLLQDEGEPDQWYMGTMTGIPEFLTLCAELMRAVSVTEAATLAKRLGTTCGSRRHGTWTCRVAARLTRPSTPPITHAARCLGWYIRRLFNS